MAVTKDTAFPVTSRDTTGNAQDVTWPTFTTPGTNRMCVAMFLGEGSTANAISSFTSPNLTWALAVAVANGGNTARVEIWTAWAASAVTAEQINTSFSSAFYNRQSVLIWSLDGTDSSGVGNTGTQTTADTPTVSVTATASGSLILAGLPYRSAGGDITVDANTTSEYDAGGGGGFNFNERACSRASTGAGSLTLGYGTAELFASWVMAGIEIKAAAGGGGGAPTPTWTGAVSPVR